LTGSAIHGPGPGLAAIEAIGLRKSYEGRTVVDIESLTVLEGEVLALLGPNGAGKTTLFRLLALLERPDTGAIRYFGKSVDAQDLTARRRTASVFQRPLLFQGSVVDNVAFGLRFRRLQKREVEKKVESTLELMGVSGLAGADMRTLSGGELQRVALARALVLEPEILFLDEPTSNLDVHVRRRFREDLRRIVSTLSATVVVITHEHNEALALAQKVAVINAGKLVQVGTPAEVFTEPQNAFVADFTGAETIWRGNVVGCGLGVCRVRTKAGIHAEIVSSAELGSEAAFAIRPEDVALSLATAEGAADSRVDKDAEGVTAAGGVTHPTSSVRNSWRGVVESVSPAGPLVRVVVRLDAEPGVVPLFGGEGEVISLVTRASAEELAISPGVQVIASAKAAALHVLRG
jgi:molybdopterin-binding protein